MDRITRPEDELELLRTLCDESIPREQRTDLLQTTRGEVFEDPEHQVVFESICILIPRGPISMERLTVHLNNRGFPDVNLEKYFQTASTHIEPKEKP